MKNINIKALEKQLAAAKAQQSSPKKRGRPPGTIAKRGRPPVAASSKAKKKGFKQFKIPGGATITISIAT